YELKFMDTSHFDASQIVFSDEVTATLDGGLFAVLRYEDSLRQAKIPTKRSVLLYGPFGTGKSSIGLITAQIATRHEWTFLSAKAGRDKLRHVLQTAKLYEPAVVFVEDIDTHTPSAADKVAISELLDVFDGIASKGDKLLVVMTTNHIEDVPAGMLRPGRLDFAIPIDGLDRNGVEKLIKAVCPPGLLSDDIDYDSVYAEMDGFQPAWVKAVADRAKSFAIDRENGDLRFKLSTPDLVNAARSLHAQLSLMNDASEGTEVDPFAEAFEKAIRDAATGMQLNHVTGEPIGQLALPPALNSSR
ncbi:MAG: AAA family ATPase, partial [Stackebrandtia sp.]